MSPQSGPQRVGIVGSGAVGTYFGVRLAQAGHDVRFLLSARHEIPTAFEITSWQGNYVLENPTVARTPTDLILETEADDELDWVVVCLKSTAFLSADNTTVSGAVLDSLVAPCVGRKTRVQLLMNGLGAEELAAERFGETRVHGGLVYGGLTRTSIGKVTHEGVPAEIRGGNFVDDPEELRAAVALWSPCGETVRYVPQDCLLKAQWAKLAWNIPFNGLTVAAGGSDVGAVWAECDDTKMAAVGLMREVVRAANADLARRGKPDAERLDEEAVVQTLSSITDKMAKSNYVPSTALDFRKKAPMEIDAIFAEPLRRAKDCGLDVPRLEMLAGLLDLIGKNN